MSTPTHPIARRALVALALLATFLSAAPPVAADVPDFDRAVRMTAREQPVDLFLEELFGRVGVPVTIDEEIVGTVNGDFEKSAREVFDDIAGSFQIALYHDGAVAHVYPSNATRRTVLSLPAGLGPRVVRSVTKMGLGDARNRVESDELGVVVIGGDRFREQIEELAEAVRRSAGTTRTVVRAAPAATVADDEADGTDVYRVFRLRYAWADDTAFAVGGQEVLVPGVASLLRALADPEALRAAPTRTRRQLERGLEGLRGEGLRSVGSGDDANRGTNGTRVTSDGRTPPLAPLPSNARIVADSLQNAVIIRDRPERMAGYETLIASLDVEPRMIEIEATIIDLDTDRLRELGVNLRLDGSDGSVLTNTGIAPGLGTDAAERDDSRGGVVSLILGDDTRFLSRIRALETQGAARVVSKPHVITLANVEAVLDTTSTFFVRVEGQEEVDLFDVSVGTTLRVTPHVFEQGGRARIKLLVAIEDGAATEGRVDDIPVIRNSSINTQALIDGGESLLIGGLVRESTGSTVSKVPVLGSIPGLGALFRSTAKSATRVERLFLISPRLSVRERAGPRHSGPILFGEEADIVASAPARTRGLEAAFARRDADRPPLDALPGGGADVSLTRRGYEAPPRERTSWPDPAPSGTPPGAIGGRGTGADESWSDEPLPFEPGDGWQSVDAPAPEPEGTASRAAAVLAVQVLPEPDRRPIGRLGDAPGGNENGAEQVDDWNGDDWDGDDRDDWDDAGWQKVVR